ncbi:MAG TPA: threonine synthase [Caulobacteraceae bacterium]|nr:threonine synthase [Caulobacteraceae bacterium]
MTYISTRGAAPPVSFLDAVLAGLAPDGGLYVPDKWPQLTEAEIAAFAGRPYAEVAADVIGRFAGDSVGKADLAEMCADAYASFSHVAVTPLVQLAPGRFLLELFHGPTLAFKDVALQLLARLYDHALARLGRRLTIVCATSGDTGGAAIEAFRGRANVKVVVLFPDGRISDVQRRFMTTADDANVACLAVRGAFDDCQAMLKDMFRDAQFARAVDLSGVNSINFARIAAQTVYYFAAAAALGAPKRKVAFAVPTGNFGDAYAGYVAHRMGLPIERIVLGVNSNDILSRALESGRYARGEVAATVSPAMDIQAASNFERLYFEAAERDPVETARAFEAFASQGAIDIPPRGLTAMRRLFAAAAVSEDETARTILSTLNETGELVDPHTAVGLAAAARIGPADPRTPLVTLSTAHPAKFPQTVKAAAGVEPAAPQSVVRMAGRKERFKRLNPNLATAKAFIAEFAKA